VSDRLLTATEVAELLAVPVSWVRESTRSGAMPHVELGRYRRYHRELEARCEGKRPTGTRRLGG
jgi:excisionase family DNA binding protein